MPRAEMGQRLVGLCYELVRNIRRGACSLFGPRGLCAHDGPCACKTLVCVGFTLSGQPTVRFGHARVFKI